jgi:hypothetical protein
MQLAVPPHHVSSTFLWHLLQVYNSANWLPRVSQSSLTHLHDTASRTELSQSFINPSNVSPIASAKYIFPLYESCAIISFRCQIGTRIIEGILREKEEASARYQDAIGRNEPASLFEQHTPDVFSTSIGNVPPGQTVKIEIEYIMELKHDAEVDGLRLVPPHYQSVFGKRVWTSDYEVNSIHTSRVSSSSGSSCDAKSLLSLSLAL